MDKGEEGCPGPTRVLVQRKIDTTTNNNNNRSNNNDGIKLADCHSSIA